MQRIFFKDVAEVQEVHFASDRDERFKGFGHVDFKTEEAAQKALALNGGTMLMESLWLSDLNELVNISFYICWTLQPQRERVIPEGRGQSQTIFVSHFDANSEEDEVRVSLKNPFGSCGEISRISIPKDYDTGAVKGYVSFKHCAALTCRSVLEQMTCNVRFLRSSLIFNFFACLAHFPKS
ncbi:LOW QUALITY PROTEIN: RRM_1 domain-containing protein [Cephalotus follicularis]|uniref:RRM_1 domain-containing protein n=1 Tax=Cephalotus follicularis TaxID=3775 RepID=A0A1Q3CVN1_CEPFO|nr:LOW QUALITY PROTEIN: RRM_1 domain-containing protein [Cephalotus follicularis]